MVSSMPSFEILSLPTPTDQNESPTTHDFSIIQDIVVPVIDPDFESITSSESEITKEEICDKIKAVIEENSGLKEKLSRNNKIMHEQLNIIAVCHDKIAETSSKHRSILENTVHRNVQLQDENDQLSKRLATLEKMLKEKKRQMKMSCVDAVCEDFDVFNDDESGYAVILPSGVNEEVLSQESIMQDSLMQSKIDQLTKELEDEKYMVANVMKLLATKEEEISNFNEAHAAFLEKEKINTDALKQEILVNVTEVQNSKKQAEDLVLQVNEKDQTIEELKLTLSSNKGKEDTLEKDLFEVKQMNQLIRDELEVAQQKIFELTATKSMKDQLLLKQEEQLLQEQQLRSDIAAVEDKKSYKMDEMLAKIMNMEQELEAERENVTKLTEQLSSEQEDSDTVKLLKVQIEAYKADFLAEKSSHQDLLAEITSLRDWIKELEMQREGFTNQGTRNRSGKSHRHRHSHHGSPETENGATLVCPKCSFGFSNLRSLENHVQRCLDE